MPGEGFDRKWLQRNELRLHFGIATPFMCDGMSQE